MGGKGSKEKPLLFGTFKVTAQQLNEEGVLKQESTELILANSEDLVFRFSSYEEGVFHIRGKFLGETLQELAFKHVYLIELLHGPPSDQAYKTLVERYDFKREASRMMFGRAVSFDVPTLLAYLYRRFALQELEKEGETLMQQSHLRRLESMSEAVKRAEKEQKLWHETDMQRAVLELEELERGLRVSTRIERS
eukprot:TRINITY_DN11494_c4_g3_i2.p1 TRINITY_DN11494_c4_g3~~TRINITY_DN11494_c4_g3_i2.p1  ORF type:complete len:194 (+),score=38.15 TRINITY_DN11494_c4_g3_i2:151-732(+)